MTTRLPLSPLLDFTVKVYEAIAPTVITAELKRGDSPTPYSEGVGGLCRVYGADYFVSILTSLGKDTLDRTAYYGYGIGKRADQVEAAYYFLRYYLDLNMYETAGANIFANKVLEKYFRQTQLPLFQKSPLYFEYFQGALALINKGWGTQDWTAVRHSSSSQVAVELEKMQNVVDSAAAAAAAKVKEYT